MERPSRDFDSTMKIDLKAIDVFLQSTSSESFRSGYLHDVFVNKCDSIEVFSL